MEMHFRSIRGLEALDLIKRQCGNDNRSDAMKGLPGTNSGNRIDACLLSLGG